MDPADEAPIHKFAGLQTGSSEAMTKVVIPPSEATSKNWALCLKVAIITDRMVFNNQFENQMRKVKAVKLGTLFRPMERGTFLVEFVDEKDKLRVQNEGPWVYRQDLVATQPCSSLEDAAKWITHGEVWIQFHNIQSEVLNEEGLHRVAKLVGKTLSDPVVGFINGKHLFKVKVQIPLEKLLNDRVKVEHLTMGDILAYVVYEKIGRLCRFCGHLGHEIDSCPDRVRLARIRNSPAGQARSDLKDILKPTHGAWIMSPTMVLYLDSDQFVENNPQSPKSHMPKGPDNNSSQKGTLHDALIPPQPNISASNPTRQQKHYARSKPHTEPLPLNPPLTYIVYSSPHTPITFPLVETQPPSYNYEYSTETSSKKVQEASHTSPSWPL